MEIAKDVGQYCLYNLSADIISKTTGEIWDHTVSPLCHKVAGKKKANIVPSFIANYPKTNTKRQVKNMLLKQGVPSLYATVTNIHKCNIENSLSSITDTNMDTASHVLADVDMAEPMETTAGDTLSDQTSTVLDSSTVSWGLTGGLAGLAIGMALDIATFSGATTAVNKIVDPIWNNTISRANRYILGDKVMDSIPTLLSNAPCKALKRSIRKMAAIPMIKMATSAAVTTAIANPVTASAIGIGVAALATGTLAYKLCKNKKESYQNRKGSLHRSKKFNAGAKKDHQKSKIKNNNLHHFSSTQMKATIDPSLVTLRSR